MLRRCVKSVLCLLVAVLSVAAVSPSASAQLPPPISPWMGMFDRSRGPGTLDNYNRNVRPQQDMMKAYANQASQIQAQQQVLQALQAQSGGSSGGGMGARDLTGTTGGGSSPTRDIVLAPPQEIPSAQRNPAGFNQYLHYYPQGSMPRRPVPNFSSPGQRR